MLFQIFFLVINLVPGIGPVFFITRKKDYVGLVDKLVLALIFSPLVIVLVSFLEEAAGIPQKLPALSANIIVLAAANIFLLAYYFRGKRHYALRLTWLKVLIYALFASLVLFRVLPAFHLLAPLAQDPIAHGFWLRTLNTSGFTAPDQWYPQGLEYYLNYYVTFFDSTYARIILIGTNYLLALFPISFFYLGYLSLEGRVRRIVASMIAFLLAASLAMPNELQLTAGKNSMIFAFALVPLLLYLFQWMKSRWDYLIAVICVFSLIIIHYPTGFFVLFIFFFYNLHRVLRIQGKRPSLNRRLLLDYLPAAVATAVFAAILLKEMLPTYLEHPPAQDNAINGLIELMDKIGILHYATRNFLGDINHVYGWLVLLGSLLSVVALVLTRDRYRALPARMAQSYAVLYLAGVLLLYLPNKSNGIFYFFELMYFLVFVLIICLSWFIYWLLERTLLWGKYQLATGVIIVCGLGVVFLLGGLNEYHHYLDVQAAATTVEKMDLEAFDYIEGDVSDGKKLLIQIGYDDQLRLIVGADSGAWITPYTGKEVEVSWLDNSAPSSFEIYQLYLLVAGNGNDLDAIMKLYCDYDIGYVFFGSRRVYSNNMDSRVLATSPYFERVFSNGAALFRIKPLECPAG